jgi:hypothetical protein
MQSSVKPIPTSVACKHTAGPIGSVGSRSETENEKVCFRISEMRHRQPPIGFFSVGGFLFLGDL